MKPKKSRFLSTILNAGRLDRAFVTDVGNNWFNSSQTSSTVTLTICKSALQLNSDDSKSWCDAGTI